MAVNGPDPASAPRRQRVAILVVAGLGVAAFAVTLGLAIALGLAAEYAVRPAAAAQDWAGREPAYATRITCARCHSTQVVDQARSAHAATSCQGCHGPLDRHAGLAAVALAGPPPVVPSSSVCLTCHAAVEGRPAFLGQISPESHYVEGCLDCHAPHTGVAARPPVVSHPLDRLPACVTCHGPDGFRARDQRHPLTPTEDAVCLGCHAVDRGATGKPGSGTAGGESP